MRKISILPFSKCPLFPVKSRQVKMQIHVFFLGNLHVNANEMYENITI